VLTIRTERHGDALHVCVIDRGTGVPSEAMHKLFEPFWTTKPGGMGIGLAMSRSIAEAHHGSLSFANLAAGGAEFCLRLPGRAAP
jgi:signal transduction histidine kinase